MRYPGHLTEALHQYCSVTASSHHPGESFATGGDGGLAIPTRLSGLSNETWTARIGHPAGPQNPPLHGDREALPPGRRAGATAEAADQEFPHSEAFTPQLCTT
jgi:hypothetical protein